MEEAPENGKELSHSAHANGMNIWTNKVEQSLEHFLSHSTYYLQNFWLKQATKYYKIITKIVTEYKHLRKTINNTTIEIYICFSQSTNLKLTFSKPVQNVPLRQFEKYLKSSTNRNYYNNLLTIMRTRPHLKTPPSCYVKTQNVNEMNTHTHTHITSNSHIISHTLPHGLVSPETQHTCVQ
jgi:hypothetical protein